MEQDDGHAGWRAGLAADDASKATPRPAAVDAAVNPNRPVLREYFPVIDMTTFDQSELYDLSAMSRTSLLDLHCTGDIDLTIFNESAGSHQQTYSHPSHHHIRNRLSAHAASKSLSYISNDHDRLENHCIVTCLKKLIAQSDDMFDVKMRERKRERGVKVDVKVEISGEKRDMEIGLGTTNRHGSALDLAKLESLDDPYGMELRDRIGGLEKEEDLLEFFSKLGGQWCSRRRKRKIVEASEFGDFLPLGWKLLLALRRKEGRVSAYCRRYISPSGHHFPSCRDVAAYLRSFLTTNDSWQEQDHGGAGVQRGHQSIFETQAAAAKGEDQIQSQFSNGLAEVKIRDLFVCHKCSMTFDGRDMYLQHLLSAHQRSSRRSRSGFSIGDGIIVNDGKYECQFCHKVFSERNRCNSHLGVHVRNYVKGIEEPTCRKNNPAKRSNILPKHEPSATISKMEALVEAAQSSSVHEKSPPVPEDKPSAGFDNDKANVVSTLSGVHRPGHLSSSSEFHRNSDGTVIREKEEAGESATLANGKSESSSLLLQNVGASEAPGGNYRPTCSVDQTGAGGVEGKTSLESHPAAQYDGVKLCFHESNANLAATDGSHCANSDKLDRREDAEIEIDLGWSNIAAHSGLVPEDTQRSITNNQGHVGIQVLPTETQGFLDHPAVSVASLNKRESGGGEDEHEEHIEASFDEPWLVEIEELKYGFCAGEEFMSVPQVADRQRQLTVSCVWCGMELDQQAVGAAHADSGSVGYMCQACKAKISGQLNEFDAASGF